MTVMKRGGSPNWFIEFSHKGETVRRTSGVPMSQAGGKAEAKKIEQRWRDEIDERQKSGRTPATLEYAMTRYFNDVIKPKLKPGKGEPDFKKKAKRIYEYFDANTLLGDITAQKVGLWKSSMLAGGLKVHAGNNVWKVTDEPMAVRSINAHLAVLRSVLTKAATEEWNLLARAPEFSSVEGAEKKCRYLEQDEAKTLLTAAVPDKSSNTKSLHLQQLLRFLLGTGARKSEALALTWRHVDLLNNHGASVYFPLTKTDEPREVPVGDTLRDMLAGMKREQEAAGYYGLSKKVFAYLGSGGFVEIKGVGSSFLTARAKAGLGEDVTLHTLRHTHASWLLQMGEPLKNVSERLGHSSIVLTADIYGHIKPKHQRPGVNLLEERMVPLAA